MIDYDYPIEPTEADRANTLARRFKAAIDRGNSNPAMTDDDRILIYRALKLLARDRS